MVVVGDRFLALSLSFSLSPLQLAVRLRSEDGGNKSQWMHSVPHAGFLMALCSHVVWSGMSLLIYQRNVVEQASPQPPSCTETQSGRPGRPWKSPGLI